MPESDPTLPATDSKGSGAGRTCTVEGCDNELYCVGICRGHYYRRRRYGTVDGKLPDNTVCQGCGCPMHTKNTPEDQREEGSRIHAGRGYCQKCRNYLRYHNIEEPAQHLPQGLARYVMDRRARGIPTEGLQIYDS